MPELAREDIIGIKDVTRTTLSIIEEANALTKDINIIIKGRDFE